MKYITFYRENNNFDDILNDTNIKKTFDEVISWHQHLTIGIQESEKNNQTFSYIALKYGDEMQNDVIKDFSPIPGIDYIPKNDFRKYIKSTE